MDDQEHIQTYPETHKVKEEAVDEDDEDQLTITKLLSTQKNLDSPSLIETERPCETKTVTVMVEKSPRGPKCKTKSVKIVSVNPSKSDRNKRKRETTDKSSDHFEAQSRAMERAKEVQARLSREFPSFIKLMMRSHVTLGFWLGLSSQFCKSHLPRHDETVVLEDESGRKYKTNFLAEKGGLSGGWRGFSMAQKLVEGDVVVFHLVRPTKFKVYIVRANDLAVADALSLLKVDAHAKENYNGAYAKKNSGSCKKAEEKRLRLVPSDILQDNVKENNMMVKKLCPRPITDQSQHDQKNLYLSDVEGCKLTGSISDFKNFNITVNGSTINSDLSKHLWTKYYDLCCSQKSYLHDHLKIISSKMATGMISEIINIADAIRASKLTTSLHDFATWDKTLEAFEMLSMKVGFLRARLNRLVTLALEATEGRYQEARVERDRTEEERSCLEQKLMELKEAKSRLDDEIEDLEASSKRHKIRFREEAHAPW
ncbi:B3 domain-containing protein Os01g0234100-like [Actinidia eriantha]|uniref:B3 domain-containing protein Os01g0234100-like n=1 Tax=Actinidia eriantha TaxID=165200 RepID=UPI0025826F23|nr:B3 domain-containing protein Os01g0234100-like [Actinidia eriantha]XP_057488133.1 B3 domain-containing protein Os01g0234100-like [Actinidia eriantha]